MLGIWGNYVQVFWRNYSSWTQDPPSSWISKFGQEEDKQPFLTFPVVKASTHGRHRITGIRQNLWRNLGEINFSKIGRGSKQEHQHCQRKPVIWVLVLALFDEQAVWPWGRALSPERSTSSSVWKSHQSQPFLSSLDDLEWIITWNMLWKTEF